MKPIFPLKKTHTIILVCIFIMIWEQFTIADLKNDLISPAPDHSTEEMNELMEENIGLRYTLYEITGDSFWIDSIYEDLDTALINPDLSWID